MDDFDVIDLVLYAFGALLIMVVIGFVERWAMHAADIVWARLFGSPGLPVQTDDDEDEDEDEEITLDLEDD